MMKLSRFDHEQPERKFACTVDPKQVAAVEDCGDFRLITLVGQNAAVRVHDSVADIEKAMKVK